MPALGWKAWEDTGEDGGMQVGAKGNKEMEAICRQSKQFAGRIDITRAEVGRRQFQYGVSV